MKNGYSSLGDNSLILWEQNVILSIWCRCNHYFKGTCINPFFGKMVTDLYLMEGGVIGLQHDLMVYNKIISATFHEYTLYSIHKPMFKKIYYDNSQKESVKTTSI